MLPPTTTTAHIVPLICSCSCKCTLPCTVVVVVVSWVRNTPQTISLYLDTELQMLHIFKLHRLLLHSISFLSLSLLLTMMPCLLILLLLLLVIIVLCAYQITQRRRREREKIVSCSYYFHLISWELNKFCFYSTFCRHIHTNTDTTSPFAANVSSQITPLSLSLGWWYKM